MKKQLLLVLFAFYSCVFFGQSTTFGIGPFGHTGLSTVTDWCGWQNNAIPFNLEHRGNQDINFLTGGVQRMKINGTGSPNPGFVSIGPGIANNRLDVFQGDIDVNQPRRSYMIADQQVLWHKGGNTNLFVGVGAGQSHGFNTLGTYNTLIGRDAGFNCSGAPGINQYNVIVGGSAGFSQSTAQSVVIIGTEAGYNNNSDNVTFVGYRAGYNFSNNGSNDTYVGFESGFSTIAPAGDNTFVGGFSGFANTLGSNNTFIGTGSGINATTGNFNTCIGNIAGANNTVRNRNNCFGVSAGNVGVGDDNVFFGFSTGSQGVGNKNVVIGNNGMQVANTGNENVAIGFQTGLNSNNNSFNTILGSQSSIVLVGSNENTMIGYKSAFNQTSGFNNTYLGETTGNNVQTGTNNTFLGSKADATNVTPILNNAAAIGANAKVTNDNHMILGDNNVNVGIGLSADPTGPGNKLEINTAAATPIPGASGLRFTDLNSTSTAITNPGTGVLSVDASGDVIYVLGGGTGTGLGNICGASPSNPLTSNWEIPLNNNNFVFSGQGLPLTNNNVGIGTNCTPQAKLHVDQASGSTNGSIGILVRNSDQTTCSGQPVIGIKSIVTSSPLQFFKAAGWFEATNAPNCFGSPLQYAIVVPQNGGVVSLGYSPPSVSGAMLDANGSISSFGIPLTSDVTLKNTVTTLPNSMNLIKRLRPVTYKWNTVNDTMMSGIHAGFIAQEVDTIIPQVVRTGNGGLKNIAYTELIPYLVSAIQSQQKTIDSLRTQMTALTSSVSSCCSSSAVRATTPAEQNQLSVNLSDKDIIVLNQNVPNPFAEQTTITYNVPEKYGYAQMIFSTIDGRILKTVDITKKGKGTITVFGSDLSSGLYTYSLIVDGKTFDTKKMVKSE